MAFHYYHLFIFSFWINVILIKSLCTDFLTYQYCLFLKFKVAIPTKFSQSPVHKSLVSVYTEPAAKLSNSVWLSSSSTWTTSSVREFLKTGSVSCIYYLLDPRHQTLASVGHLTVEIYRILSIYFQFMYWTFLQVVYLCPILILKSGVNQISHEILSVARLVTIADFPTASDFLRSIILLTTARFFSDQYWQTSQGKTALHTRCL